RGLRIVDALVQVAKRNDATPATVALAWIIARPSVTAPIASATSAEQLESLAAATRLQLPAEDLKLLNDASAPAQ
ncbi:aldo/keto reductase, partial [Paraburkholderia sp. RL18-103-BIB-C]